MVLNNKNKYSSTIIDGHKIDKLAVSSDFNVNIENNSAIISSKMNTCTNWHHIPSFYRIPIIVNSQINDNINFNYLLFNLKDIIELKNRNDIYIFDENGIELVINQYENNDIIINHMMKLGINKFYVYYGSRIKNKNINYTSNTKESDPLYYHKETDNNIINIKIPSLKAGETKTIYISENSEYSSFNNPENVYDYFCKFSNVSVLDSWTIISGSKENAIFENGVMKLPLGNKYTYNIDLPNSYRFISRFKPESSIIYISLMGDGVYLNLGDGTNNSNEKQCQNNNLNGSNKLYYNLSNTQFYTQEYRITDIKLDFYADNIQYFTQNILLSNKSKLNSIVIYNNNSSKYLYMDYIAIAEYFENIQINSIKEDNRLKVTIKNNNNFNLIDYPIDVDISDLNVISNNLKIIENTNSNLYYDKNETNLTIKIPYVKANSSNSYYMTEKEGFEEYNNPYKVYDFYNTGNSLDDFEIYNNGGSATIENNSIKISAPTSLINYKGTYIITKFKVVKDFQFDIKYTRNSKRYSTIIFAKPVLPYSFQTNSSILKSYGYCFSLETDINSRVSKVKDNTITSLSTCHKDYKNIIQNRTFISTNNQLITKYNSIADTTYNTSDYNNYEKNIILGQLETETYGGDFIIHEMKLRKYYDNVSYSLNENNKLVVFNNNDFDLFDYQLDINLKDLSIISDSLSISELIPTKKLDNNIMGDREIRC